jgi:hypothetical protein
VEGIRKLISLFAEWQQCAQLHKERHPLKQASHRSVSGALNANGIKLWHSADGISGATLANRFLEVLWEESSLVNPQNSICYTSSLQNEYPALPKCFGFPLSQYSCPRETRLVIGLLNGLLLRISGGTFLPFLHGSRFDGRNEISQIKVCISCFTLLPI